MPYIKQEDREKFNSPSCECPMEAIGSVAENAGDLNYAITMILQIYMKKKGECYATHNEIVGMLECCKNEWQRRRLNPYEDTKIEENGDT